MESKEIVPLVQINIILKKYKKEFTRVIRYARFMSGETIEEWAYLLGEDIILFSHGKITDKLTQEFIAYNKKNGIRLSSYEESLLRTAALIHDWGEVIIEGRGVGDISFDKKLDFHRTEEFKIFNQLLTNLPSGENKTIILKAYYSVAMNIESNLGRTFNAVERVGFVKNSIDAYLGKEGKKIKNYKGLVGNVLSNQIIPLLNFSKEFTYVAQFLTENNVLIVTMFEDILVDKKAPLDEEGGYSYKRKKVLSAFNFWKHSKLYIK